MQRPAIPTPDEGDSLPRVALAALIAGSLVLRLILASGTGLGVDESYMVAAGGELQLSYFDHPPIAWWLAWAAAHLTGSDAEIVVRLPFLALYALSTWVMFRLTAYLFGKGAGLWAALAFNLSPIFGVTFASWVLPDGPLTCALLIAAYCFVRANFDEKPSAAWWAGCGAAAGVALLSKYTAVLPIAGAGLFLATCRPHRGWLRTPKPYVAALIAVAVFLPAIVWNAEHAWASFSFQGGRAAISGFRPWQPLVTLAGQALFLLPWIWLILIVQFIRAVRTGPQDERRWMLACLAGGPILFFTIVSAWSPEKTLFHWAAPGYLMLFPLAGDWLFRQVRAGRSWVRPAAVAIAVFIMGGTAGVASEVAFNWVPLVWREFEDRRDPDMEGVDWSSVRAEVVQRAKLPGQPNLVVAALRWNVAAKIDYALDGALTVVCLCDDPRQYGIAHPLSDLKGRDFLILDDKASLADVRAKYGAQFDAIGASAPPTIEVMHGDRPAFSLNVQIARNLH